MKHLDELSGEELLDLRSLVSVPICEKLDGSFICVGRDSSGRLYVQRKSPVKYYSVDDWPQLAWANDFRAAHVVLEDLYGWLKKEQFVEFELIAGPLSNTVEYRIGHNTNLLIITNSNVNLPTLTPTVSFLHRELYDAEEIIEHVGENAITNIPEVVSTDGINLEYKARKINWLFMNSKTTWIKTTQIVSDAMYRILSGFTDIKNVGFVPNYRILDCKLNEMPSFVHVNNWKLYKREIVQELKTHRARIRAKIKEAALDNLYVSGSPYDPDGEGVVVFYKDLTKMVDRSVFGVKNNFTHIVKYWLMGGRRPARPCFLSRTKDWPLEKRLARLETLRQRFVKHHERLQYVNPKSGNILSYAHPQLYKRTIVLFAEIREGLINGRFSVQRQSSQDSSS